MKYVLVTVGTFFKELDLIYIWLNLYVILNLYVRETRGCIISRLK